MNKSISSNLKEMKLGILLILATILFGYGLGVYFGGFESDIKSYLKSETIRVQESAYQGDTEKMKKVATKSWSYIKRAHFHANGIATTAAVLVALLAMVEVPTMMRKSAALAMGFGGLGYSLFWLFSGLAAPGLGSNGAAKEAYRWLGAPTAGLIFIGVVLSIYLISKALFTKEEAIK